MEDRQRDRTLALAGVFQCASLVQDVAHRGSVDDDALSASIGSIFAFEAPTTEDVYGGAGGVLRGLELIRGQIRSGGRSRDLELTKYVVALLHLERKLARRPDLLDQIREGIVEAQGQAQYFDSYLHESVLARLADLYGNTVSVAGPRIMVTGERTYLGDPDKANLIRALLLAGIRSAVLWRQRGGRRLQLVFARRRLLDHTERLLATESEER